MHAVLHETQYRILVTITEFTDFPGKVCLTAAVVYKKNDENYLVDLVKASDHNVDPEYKNAAICNIGKVYLNDLITNKVIGRLDVLSN